MKREFSLNLTERLVESLGSSIVNGTLPEDSIITANELQEQYGVSRTVVREALQILQSKGLIQSRTKVGTTIRGRRWWNLLDPEVIAWYRDAGAGAKLVTDLGEVRENLEPWAARIAADRRSAQDVLAIRQAYDTMAETAILAGPDSSASIQADLDFHQLVLEATHNDIMIRLGLLIRPVMQIRNELTLSHDSSIDFLENHRLVLEAIEQGQPDAAESAMRDLIELGRRETSKFVGEPGHPATQRASEREA